MRTLLSALSVGLFALVAAPQNALACHKGDPGVPHGTQTNCDGDGAPTTKLVFPSHAPDRSTSLNGHKLSLTHFPIAMRPAQLQPSH